MEGALNCFLDKGLVGLFLLLARILLNKQVEDVLYKVHNWTKKLKKWNECNLQITFALLFIALRGSIEIIFLIWRFDLKCSQAYVPDKSSLDEMLNRLNAVYIHLRK